MLREPNEPHEWVPSLCACHPHHCAQLVTGARGSWYDLCGRPATDKVHLGARRKGS